MLDSRFRAFLAFYFPSIHRRIDWRYRPVSLGQELRRFLPRGRARHAVVDKLVKVRLLGGERLRILVHVEIQGRKLRSFAERMFTCRYRIWDFYRRPVSSLAVYTGRGKGPEGRYEDRPLGCELTFRFPVVSLERFRSRRRALERSRNPFAAVTLAHLGLSRAKSPRDVLEWKKHVAARLSKQGFGREDIIGLYRFLDWLMVLPPELEREYEEYVDELERRESMPFLTNRERRAEQKGRRKGRAEGRQEGQQEGRQEGLVRGTERTLREAVERGLELRFGEAGRGLASRVAEIGDLDVLREVLAAIFRAERIEDVVRVLPEG